MRTTPAATRPVMLHLRPVALELDALTLGEVFVLPAWLVKRQMDAVSGITEDELFDLHIRRSSKLPTRRICPEARR